MSASSEIDGRFLTLTAVDSNSEVYQALLRSDVDLYPEEISNRTGLSTRTVQRSLSELVECGRIRISRNVCHTSLYEVDDEA